MAFRILLTENASPVGAALFKALENYQHPVVCPDVPWRSWCDETYVDQLLDTTGPVVVINTLHQQGPVDELADCDALARLCARRDLTVIHLSSFAVFGREQQAQTGAAGEALPPSPDSTLGEALLQTELAFAQVRRAIILRSSRLLDSSTGMIAQVCTALRAADTVEASDRWRLTPVYVEDVVRTIVAMLQQILCGAENWGVFHLHSSDVCSEAEFIDCIARNLRKYDCDVAPLVVRSNDEQFFDGNAWLQGSRCTNDFGVQKRSWRKGLRTKIEAWLANEGAAAGCGEKSAPGADFQSQ